MRHILSAHLAIVSYMFVGCTALGDVLIPPHTHSDIRDPELTCLYIRDSDQKAEVGEELMAQGVAALVGLVVDQSAKVVEKEAGRYKASFSARDSSDVYWVDGNTLKQKVKELELIRYVGEGVIEGCKELDGKMGKFEKAFSLSSKIEISPAKDAIQIRPAEMLIYKSKAKVPALTWWPHTWWRVIDQNAGKVEYSVRATINVINETQDTVNQNEIMKADMPLGKFKLTGEKSKVKISNISSGWAPLPHVTRTPSGQPQTDLPITIVLSVTETDSLGDVLADASKQISNNKQKAGKAVLKLLGLEATQ